MQIIRSAEGRNWNYKMLDSKEDLALIGLYAISQKKATERDAFGFMT